MVVPARHRRPAPALCLTVCLTAASAAPAATFYNFESPQTHPIALSPDGTRLYAVNTADNRLSVFDAATLARLAEVPVGMEPVSVAPRPGAPEVWVANHLSDAVDVVSTLDWRVIRTIPVGDEPAAIAFLPGGGRAYVTLSRPDRLAVVDAVTRAVGPVIGLGSPPPNGNTEDPRGVAVDRTGAFVYVVPFESGNRTRGEAPPLSDPNRPKGSIVLDPLLTDTDLFVIRASDNAIVAGIESLGTILTNVRVSPDNSRIYVTGWDARNLLTQIENLGGHPTVNLLTILDRATLGVIARVDLDGPQPYARGRAVAQPHDVAFDGAGRLWVAAQGNDEVVILDRDGNRLGRVPAGRAPRGLAFDPATGRLFVFNRLSRDVTVIDTAAESVLATVPIGYAPDPPFMEGRRFLYTAEQSGDGTQACAACHTDGHLDNLVWDVGSNADPKGPMVTQTLRGLKAAAPYHWRGERPDLLSFNVAFRDLFNGTMLSDDDNARLAAAMESVEFPPNPNLNRDGSFRHPLAPCGFELFIADQPFPSCPPLPPGEQHRIFPCVACHAFPQGSNHQIIPASLLGTAEDMEVPGTRGLFDRIAFVNDGRDRTLVQFLSNSPPFPQFPLQDKQAMEAFMLEFPSDHHAAVGTETTATQALCPGGVLNPDVAGTISFLEAEANAAVVDLVAAGTMAPYGPVHLLFDPAVDAYLLDRTGPGPVAPADLRAAACAGTASLTFTGWAAGMGDPRARDSDEDGVMSGDEAGLATDPRDPDTDDDLLEDGEEAAFGTSPTDADTDDDGTEDGQEVADGTGPTNPASVLKFLSVDPVPGTTDVDLTWTTVFGRRYVLRKLDGGGFLTGSEVFSDLFTTPGPEGESPEGTETFRDSEPQPPAGACRFYRVAALPPGS